MNELATRWGALILCRRKARGMNQVNFAAALGVTQQTVSRWETGQVVPASRYHRPLIALLEVGADELHAIYGDDGAAA